MQRLRQDTQAAHQNVEAAIPLMHSDLDLADYLSCLGQIHGVVAAWEEAAASFAPEWLQASLQQRRRLHLLELDLQLFGVSPPVQDRCLLPRFSSLPALLGAMYVMEGSTLGGQLIARHVETALHLTGGHGSAFFRGHGSQTGPMWKEFCDMFKTSVSDEETDSAISSANAMFAAYGNWMHRNPAVIDG
jgi:heme oxygenase